MSDTAERLRALASEIRRIPEFGCPINDSAEMAGRLLKEAFDAGAFRTPKWAAFRTQVLYRFGQCDVSGDISGWNEARSRLRGWPNVTVPKLLDDDFPGDCEAVAVALESEAATLGDSPPAPGDEKPDDETNRFAALAKLPPVYRKAYFSLRYAESKLSAECRKDASLKTATLGTG